MSNSEIIVPKSREFFEKFDFVSQANEMMDQVLNYKEMMMEYSCAITMSLT